MPRSTAILVGALVLLLVVDAAAHVDRDLGAEALPALAAVAPADVTRLVLTHGDDKIVLERQGPDRFAITAPYAYPADDVAVDQVLGLLHAGVAMDVRVDQGDFKTYGLVSPDAIQVEVDGTAGPIESFYVGNNAAGGTTFFRFADGDAIFRARVGGRARWEKSADDWRDPMVLSRDPADVVGIGVERRDGAMALSRTAGLDDKGAAKLGPWQIDGHPDVALDQDGVGDLVRALAHLRAGAILSPDHPAGVDDPLATVTLRGTKDSDVLLFGRTSEGTFCRRKGAQAVYAVAPVVLDRLLRPIGLWRDRQLVAVRAEDVVRVTLVEPDRRTVLEPVDGAWKVVSPPNVAVDPTGAGVLARALAAWKAEDVALVAPSAAGFPSKTRIEVALADKSVRTVEVGKAVPGRADGQDEVYVRNAEEPDRVAVVAATTWSKIRKALGR